MGMIHRLSGINPYDIAIDIALGRSPTWQPRWTGGGEAIRWVMPSESGVFHELTGVRETLADPQLRGMGVVVRTGARVTATAQHCGDRLAWLIREGADWASADHRAAELADQMRPVVRQ